MIQVNFKEFPFYGIDGKIQNTQDLSSIVGNGLYQTQKTLEAFDLAQKIAKSEEAIELSDTEIELIKNLMEVDYISPILPFKISFMSQIGEYSFS